jgi:hypothetical protein
LAIKQFAKEVGAPAVLVCDPHPAQIKREVREFCTQIGMSLKVLEAETQWDVQSAVRNVEDHLAKSGEKLPYKAPTPLLSGYRSEIDVSSELRVSEASYFHSLVGVLQWIDELGRVDIDVKVLMMMSSHLALPRVGHLKEIYHIFAYLKAHSNTEMVFNPTPVALDMNLFEQQDWSYLPYGCEVLSEENTKQHAKTMWSLDDNASVCCRR